MARSSRFVALALLAIMCIMAGGSAWRESTTVDEVAHVGAGLSYLQAFDMRLNPEHPPLAKMLAALPLVLRGTNADYHGPAWNKARTFLPAYFCQFVFGDAVLGRWNPWRPTLLWSRVPMLLLTLWLGWMVYLYAARMGGEWGGLLCLALYVSTPAFLVFGPLVLTDVPVTLFTLIALWQIGEVWKDPSRRNAFRLSLPLAGALLSKFTGVLLFVVILILVPQTRFWPTAMEPLDKLERKVWRRARWRALLRASAGALVIVYAVYLVFSWRQPNDALEKIGTGDFAGVIRRPLMPVWLYVRGFLLMLLTGSRPTYLFGRTYPHGVPFYFPVVFALKSTLGFLGLLVLAAGARVFFRRVEGPRLIPDQYRPHWRVLCTAFFVFLTVCLASRLDISIRHFMVPIVLLILFLAPLPRLVARLPGRRIWETVTLLLAISSVAACVSAYPYFFPFVNSLASGAPVYRLVNDSNVSWNEALPQVERFATDHHLAQVKLDWAAISDPALVVPQAQSWDCQAASQTDAGQWVFVAAVSILENHNCGYLQSFPHEALAGGSMYAFHLPDRIAPAGSPGGPPAAAERRVMWGMPFDMRLFSIEMERHPDKLSAELDHLMKRFQKRP